MPARTVHPCVIVESPYRGAGSFKQITTNVAYARLCVRDSVLRGEAPIASHLLFTQRTILDDTIPHERAMGVAAGLAWLPKADYGVFYTDRGWSHGMLFALHDFYLKREHDFRIRSISGGTTLPAALDEDVERFLRSKVEA